MGSRSPGHTYVTADLFHVPVHEEEPGDLLRGPLQESVQQGDVSAPQLLLLCGAQEKWRRSEPTAVPSDTSHHHSALDEEPVSGPGAITRSTNVSRLV